MQLENTNAKCHWKMTSQFSPDTQSPPNQVWFPGFTPYMPKEGHDCSFRKAFDIRSCQRTFSQTRPRYF